MRALEQAIANRDVEGAVAILFERVDGRPQLRSGFGRESDLWDFKAGLPGLGKQKRAAWAEIAADIAAFHNQRGGIVVFGIRDADFSFVGTRDFIDSKQFNDQVRRYLGDKVWIEFSREFVQANQRYLGIALVPPTGIIPVHMRADAPPRPNGDRAFEQGDLPIRIGDETKILRGAEAAEYLRRHRLPQPLAKFAVDEPGARIMRPDWGDFIYRDSECSETREALLDERTYVATLTGPGGVGKTALAVWAALEAYKESRFEFYVSVTAKDRELTPLGVTARPSDLSSFEDLLGQVLETLGFPEETTSDTNRQERVARELLSGSNTLLLVDNLETVEDKRVIQFIETLPKPVKAITTSRTAVIKRAAYPIQVGPLDLRQASEFITMHARLRGRGDILSAPASELERIIRACAFVPLAIEWLVGQAKSLSSALGLAGSLESSGKTGQELLEFCFRRVYDQLVPVEQNVLSALTLSDKPMVIEAVAAATGELLDVVEDALENLHASSLVERTWDEKMRAYASRILPLTRRFAYHELQTHRGAEIKMRSRMSDWYSAADIRDPEARDLIAKSRKGDRDPDVALVDAAIAYRHDGKFDEAEKFFNRAIERNPHSLRAHRELGELHRDRDQTGAALDCYKRAIELAPTRGPDRALVFREAGMLYKKSGLPDAVPRAIECLEVAKKETPNDEVLLHALADCYVKLGQDKRAQPLLERLVQSHRADTRARSYDLLERVYGNLHETLKLLTLQDERAKDHAAENSETTMGRVRAVRAQAFKSREGRRSRR